MVNQIKYPNLIKVATTEANDFIVIRSVTVIIAAMFMILYGIALI